MSEREERSRGRGGDVGEAESTELGELFTVLHREHEQVDQLLERLLGTKEQEQRREIWDEFFLAMYAHSHAEEEQVYPATEKQEDLADLTEHAIDEHHRVEQLMMEIDQLNFGDRQFTSRVRELVEAVREHVQEEEQELLPNADFTARQQSDLVKKFSQRRDQILQEMRASRGEATGSSKGSSKRGGSQQQKSSSRSSGTGRRSGGGTGSYADKTVKELQQIARDRNIRGRSRMKKDELVRAIRRAR